MKVPMVITSHDQLGITGRKTGFWLEELAAPYYTFKDAGVEITLASPKGGRPPLDPKSNEPAFRTDLTLRFEKDASAEAQLDKTVRLDSIRQEDFDTVFYPGGHGPIWDLAEDKNSIRLIESFLAAGKPIGSCAIPRARCVTSRRQTASFWFGARKSPASPTAKRKKSASPKSCLSLLKMRC
jgi:putative intracellular protease/amidase